MKNEKSAGGAVLKKTARGVKILMVRVKNLESKVVWTFPKGHLEGKETAAEAALREVLEETGWQCEIVHTGRQKILKEVRYFFFRGKTRVRKTVVWFLMRPLKKIGTFDAEEIQKVAWVSLKTAAKKITYPSDAALLKTLR